LMVFVLQMLAVIWFISGINNKLYDPENFQELHPNSTG
jgi:hypothetical protein